MTEPNAWLLKGDPSIRWQVMRDLLEEPPKVYEEERARSKPGVGEAGFYGTMIF